jgi:site-specific recombinase XerD
MLYAAWLRERQAIPRAAECPWVFVSFPGPASTVPGEPLSTRRIYAVVEGLARRAGLRHIHPHMLRHSFASTAADMGVARDVLQNLLGQQSVASQDAYRHPSPARLVEGATAVWSTMLGEDR